MPIVYKVTNSVNSKVYIGKTIETLEKRKDEHYRNAFNYLLESKFYRAIRKYGFENFVWEIIATYSTNEECLAGEIEFIKTYSSFTEGYNMTIGGEGSLGRIVSDETKEKIRTSLKTYYIDGPRRSGFTHSEETRKLISEKVRSSNRKVRTGPMSDAAKQKMRERKQKVLLAGTYKPANTKLSRDQVLAIKYLISTGAYSQKCISNAFGISTAALYNIVKGITYKNISK